MSVISTERLEKLNAVRNNYFRKHLEIEKLSEIPFWRTQETVGDVGINTFLMYVGDDTVRKKRVFITEEGDVLIIKWDESDRMVRKDVLTAG